MNEELIHKDFQRLITKTALSYDEIIYTIDGLTGIKTTVMKQHIRCAPVVRSRDLFFYCSFQFHQNLSEIGRFLGFDHATVLYSVKKVINTNDGKYFEKDMKMIMNKLIDLNNIKLKFTHNEKKRLFT